MNPQDKINQMKQVIADTEGKTDPVSVWARRGVRNEAGSNISYLKRVGSVNAEKYIEQLTSILESE